MTYEVELKFRLTDSEGMTAQLAALGAVPVSLQCESDEYFSHPSRDFSATDEALRIRTAADACWLTYKGPAENAYVKTRQEIEIRLGSENESRLWREVFLRLGFQPAATVSKVRRLFRLNHHGRPFTLALDHVPSLGWFLEIEVLADPGDIATAQAAVQELAGCLGLVNPEEKTYLELMTGAAAAPAERFRAAPP